MTKPSRRASNGREMPLRDSAPMRSKAAMHSGVIPASVPPATTTSASPRSIMRFASPIAWLPVAHADDTLKPGPWAPSAIAIMPAAALGIIIGTNSGDTARTPPVSGSWNLRHSFSSVSSPPTPVPISTARRSGSTSPGRPASAVACAAAAHRQLRVAVGATRILRRHRDRRIEVRARSAGQV